LKKTYVQYGCGLCAPEEWINFDISPTLRIQKIPVLGDLIKGKTTVVFPANVKYGDIVKGLPVPDDSCDAVFCSHTLEHLSLEDFKTALTNTYRILKPGGIFRCIVPDLEVAAREYIQGLDAGRKDASIQFLSSVLLGQHSRPRGLKQLVKSALGNSHHLWMWDVHSLSLELEKAGFRNIRPCTFDDSNDPMFRLVESEGRYWHAAAIECIR
jgi:SAM-dependent methyltransferase